MLNYFKELLSSENDQDPSWVRLVRVVLTFATLAMLVIASIDGLTNLGHEGTGLYAELILALLSGMALFYAYRNIYWPGKLLVPLGALVAVTYLAINADGLYDSSISGFILVIILASLLTGRKAIPVATILTVLGTLVVAYADITGLNKSPLAHNTGWFNVVVICVIQIIAAASLNALMARLNATLEKSRKNEQAQIESNQKLRELQAVLELRVTERTHGLELAAEVGRSVSQVRDLTSMLREAAETIRSRFDLYYVQVYLTDPAQNTLVLQSGTGTVGVELAARGHRLPINTGSTNGRAAVEKRSVVISDTAASLTFRPNPLLPDTRSEMAVPLLAGENVVGVLDLQSKNAGMLNQDMLPAFEALAGQLAIAIQNASLLAEAEQARADLESQARRLSHAEWIEYLDAIHKPEQTGFVFEGDSIVPLTGAEIPDVPATSNIISAPIAVTGESLGSLVVEMNAENRNSRDAELVKTVARQVAQQIENLRLLDSAERYRSEAEKATRRLTRDGWNGYLDEKGGQSLGYLYDLNEVKPAGQEMKLSEGATSFTLPVKVRNEAVGKLVIQGLDTGDNESIALANAVAERLGSHIEGLRQYDQTQSALAQSEKLFEASRSLTQATDLQELVKAVVSSLGIPSINRAVLATFNYDQTDSLESLDIISNWWNGIGHEVTPIGTHYPLEVIRVMPMFVSPTPVFFNDAFQDERVDKVTLELVKRQNLRAVAVLPLHLGSHQIGALILEAEEPCTFTQSQTTLFSALAPQIATVLENRRQFERAQKQAERETTLNVISQKIQSATTVEAVLQIAARELGHALGSPLTIAQLGIKDNH